MYVSVCMCVVSEQANVQKIGICGLLLADIAIINVGFIPTQ